MRSLHRKAHQAEVVMHRGDFNDDVYKLLQNQPIHLLPRPKKPAEGGADILIPDVQHIGEARARRPIASKWSSHVGVDLKWIGEEGLRLN